jgi:proteic killer suppression protein
MIKRFRHKGIQQFFETGTKAGIAAEHEAKLARQLLTGVRYDYV